MHIHKSWHDGLASDVENLGVPRNRDLLGWAHRRDAIARDHHGAVLDHLFALHRNEAAIGECERSHRHVPRHFQIDRSI